MDEPILKISNLTKKFDSYTAVNNVSFEVSEGEIVGLLGPNGAGKTTTISILLGLTTPTSGTVEVFGQNINNHRQKILQKTNFASAYSQMQSRLTVYENLMVFAYLYNVPNKKAKIEGLLSDLKIKDLRKKLFLELSAGQRTRVVLAKSLINDPKLLLLDEPTASLDPDFAIFIQDIFLKINRERKLTMLYTSHNMEEVAKMCNRIIFLNRGKIVASDTPLNLTKKIKRTILILTFEGDKAVVMNYLLKQNLKTVMPRENLVEIEIEEIEIPKTMINLSQLGIWITDIDIKKPTLSDVFLEIANTKVKDEEAPETKKPRGQIDGLINKIFKKKN